MKVCGGPLIKMGRIGDVFFSCNDFIRSVDGTKTGQVLQGYQGWRTEDEFSF